MTRNYTPQNAPAVEAEHPGYTAVAGPYIVNHRDKAMQRYERALCVRSHRDQAAICPKARIIMHGPQAWIIRKKPMITETDERNRSFTSGDYGIKAGNALKAAFR